MRSDANSLLQKLSQQSFRYQEFPDAFADLEPWPLFEAMLNDDRLIAKKTSRLERQEQTFQAAKERGLEANKPAEVVNAPFATLYSVNGNKGHKKQSEDDAASGGRADFRSFLSSLGSDKI
ncbi:hypothetical protein D6851_00965 [Altericroceibacterium spongiae]|uniref:Uncharacterized protein n=1 Tax=Altericroceibacterium spongiae TaxID=2320269 RepID=A0A420ER03_9SPHN|nr:hypothetical protein [Altericroceibacterium spongiae]RKF23102.1 hypothetical protein D6851_00965 [Altericroceibacterium spongiae]